MELFWTVGLKNILYNIHNIPNILYHLKYIIDSHKAVVRKVSQVDLKAIFASRCELVDIFQAYHSFTWRSLVEGWLGILGRDIFCAFSSSFCTDKNNSVWPRSRFARLKKKWRKYIHRHCHCHFNFFSFLSRDHLLIESQLHIQQMSCGNSRSSQVVTECQKMIKVHCTFKYKKIAKGTNEPCNNFNGWKKLWNLHDLQKWQHLACLLHLIWRTSEYLSWSRLAQLAELSRSDFDPKLFSDST